MIESIFLSLQNLIALYLLKLKYLLDYYINLYSDFFNKIKSSHIYFDHMLLKHQLNIVEIMIYYKIIKKNFEIEIKHIIIKDILYDIEIFLSIFRILKY